MQNVANILHITHVTKIGSYLKVYGQKRKEDVVRLEHTVQRVIELLTQKPAPTYGQLDIRTIVLGRRNKSDFGRCKITGIGPNGMVAVYFIDYGLECQLPLSEIRILDYFNMPEIELLKTAEPLIMEFILSRVHGDFTSEQVTLIRQELCSVPVNVTAEDKIGTYSFIGISLNGYDYTESLILRHIGKPITTEQQKEIIYQIMKTVPMLPAKNPKANLINIPESKQMIMSHLSSNQPRPITPIALATSPIVTNVPPPQPQSMVYMAQEPSAAMYIQPPPQHQQQLYHQQHINHPYSGINKLNQPNLNHNPYAPQASATYNPPVQTQSNYKQQPEIMPTFKSNELRPDVKYTVFCSYIEDGPNLFSVQLKSSEEVLDQMMSDLSNIPLKNLSQSPKIGMACIARYSEDKHLYRAVIMNIMPTKCQVVYVDYGNSEQVAHNDIYEIPQEFLQHSIFALRFALAGYTKLEPLTNQIKTYFKKIAMENELTLMTAPSDEAMFIQYCNLYYNGQSIMELLLNKIKECPTYAPPLPLIENEFVVIRYVESPKKFFIQQTKNMLKYEEMMDSLMIYCQTALSVKNPQKGTACAAKYGQDKDWYRVEILQINNNEALIQFVDFGICNETQITELKEINFDFLTLPRQAIECCLNGFENIPNLSELSRDQLELLAEDSNGHRRNFRTKIVGTRENSVLLVNLHDESENPPMDLSIRMFQLSMPPKTFRYLEQHKFKKPAITAGFGQNQQKPLNAIENDKDSIDSTLIHKDNHQQQKQMDTDENTENTSNTSNTSNWDENSLQQEKNDKNWNNENSDCSNIWNNQNKSNTWQNKNSDKTRYNNTSSRTGNWDAPQKLYKTQSNISDNNDDLFGKQTNNEYKDNRKNYRNDKREYSNHSNDNRNNDRSYGGGSVGRNRRQDYNPKSDSYNNDRQNKFNRSPDADWNESTCSNSGIGGSGNSSGGGCSGNNSGGGGVFGNASSIKSEESASFSKPRNNSNDSWNYNDKNQSKNSSDLGYSGNRRYDTGGKGQDNNGYGKQHSTNIYNNTNRKDYSPSKRSDYPSNEYEQTKQQQTTPDIEKFIDIGEQLSEPLVPLNETHDVALSWWISPIEFYVYLKQYESEFESMMGQMQKFYKNYESTFYTPLIDNYVCVKNQHDQVFYRALVLAHNEKLHKFKVHLVDLGKKSIVQMDDIRPLEERFVKLAKMAIKCSMNVALNADRNEIQTKIDCCVNVSKRISCEFLSSSMDSSVNFVNIFVEELNLKEHLIEEGLISANVEALESTILIGQIITVLLVSVESLSKFSVQLYGCHDTITCMYNDYKTDTDLSVLNEFRQQFTGKYVKIRIDNVNNDKMLMVTPLIELFGYKTSLEICPCPILSSITDVTIAFIDSVNIVYVHICKNAGDLSQLLDDMFNIYEESDSPICDNLSVDKLYAVKSADGNWYRSNITAINTDNVYVKYIDYGNYEQVPLENIKELNDTFREKPAFAIKIYLPLTTTASESDENNHKRELVKQELITLTTENTLQMIVMECYSNHFIGDLCMNDISVITMLRDKEMANYIDLDVVRSMIVNEPNIVCEENVSTVENCNGNIQKRRYTAYINHLDHPDRFFVQLESDQKDLYQLQDNLQIVAPSLPPLDDFTAGKLCIVKYTVDDLWYRAIIIDSDSEITSIQFIDYGNTDTITDNSLIKSMNEAFADVKRFSIPCALPLSPKDSTEWNDDARKLLQEIAVNVVQFEYVCRNEIKNLIRLYAGERDILQELIDAGLACPLDIIQSGELCYVSHINSLNDFYIQMEKDTNGLELITSYLADENQFDVVDDIVEGTICTAQFIDDNQWYRATILHKLPDKTEVLFIDYGNTSFTTNIRALPDKIAKLPHLSKRCSLHLPITANIEEWSLEANQKFHEIAGMGATVFTVNLVSLNEPAIVDLLIDNETITIDLIDLCKQRKSNVTEINVKEIIIKRADPLGKERSLSKGYIINLSNYNDFYINFNEEKNQIDNMSIVLNSMDYELTMADIIEIGHLYAVKNEEDNSYYRGKLIEKIMENEYKCQLIDCGTTIVTSDIRILPESTVQINPLAIHCNIANISCVEMQQQLSQFLQENITELFEFEYDNLDRQTINNVSVYLNGTNIINLVSNTHDANNINDIKTNNEISGSEFGNDIIVSVENENQSTMIFEHVIIDTDIQKFDNKLEYVIEETALDSSNDVLEAFVTIFNSSNDFYIQFNQQKKVIENLSESMKFAFLWPAIDDTNIGALCAALNDCNMTYYRAEILEKINDEEYRVYFIDYGNVLVTKDVRQLPDEIKTIEKLAIKCALKETVSSVMEQNRLYNFIQKNITALYTMKFHQCYPNILSIFKDGINIIELVNLIVPTNDTNIEKIPQSSIDNYVMNNIPDNTIITSDTSEQINTNILSNLIDNIQSLSTDAALTFTTTTSSENN